MLKKFKSLAIGLIGLMLFSCASASAETVLRMWTFVNPQGKGTRERVLRQLIEGFQAENPGVRIEVERTPWQQISDKFLAAHQTGTGPDITTIQQRRVYEAVKLGALANLDELFIKNWSKEELADIDGPLFRYAADEKGHYQIMHWISTRGYFYRKDLFARAGIDPKSLTSWDAFIQAAKKLTQRDAQGNVKVWGFGQAYPTEGANLPIMGNVMLDEQGKIFNEDGTANWATPAGIKGLTLQTDMVTKLGITPAVAASLNYEDVYDQFNAGRYAIIGAGVTRMRNAMDALGAENVGYLRTPTFAGDHYAPVEAIGWSMGIWSGSPNKELAGKWLEFMSSPKADTLWATVAGMVPIRKSTLKNNAAFFAKPENAYLLDTAADLENGWLSPAVAVGGFNEDMHRAGQEVIVNGADPEEALKQAEKSYNRRLH